MENSKRKGITYTAAMVGAAIAGIGVCMASATPFGFIPIFWGLGYMLVDELTKSK